MTVVTHRGPSLARRLPSRLGRLLVVLVLLAVGACAGLVADAVLASSARAAGSPIGIAVHPSTGSPSFSSGSTVPLLDTRALSALAPGGSVSGVMAVENDSGGLVSLTLALTTLDECPSATAASTTPSASCTAQGKALAGALRFTVDVADQKFGAGVPVTSKVVDEDGLAAGVPIATNLTADGVRWVRLTASLPENGASDDAVQFGAIGFDLAVGMDNGVGGVSTHTVGPGKNAHGHSSHGHGVGGLATTGVQVVLLAVLAALLVAIGVVLVIAGRRHDARAAHGPSSQM